MTRTSYFMFQIRLFCSDFNYSSCHQFFSLGKVVFNILIFFFPWSNKSMTSHWCITGPGETVVMMCKNSTSTGKSAHVETKKEHDFICVFLFLMSGGPTCHVTRWRRGRERVRIWGRWVLPAWRAGRKPAPSTLWGWTAINSGWSCHRNWVPSGPNRSTCHL